MNKKIWIIGGIAVLVAVILGWIVWGGSTAAGGYKTEAVTRGDISVVITATGKVNPVTRVQVGTQITGTISRIFADFNQKVRKGQEIAEIDPTFLKAQLLEAEANAEKAKAQVEQSKKTLDRATELFDRKLISQSEKDEALTNYNLAGAQYKQAMAAYNRAEVSLRYTSIVSPIDGVVISRNVDVGQTVAASLQAPILFVIANDLSKIQVEATIDEVDIGKVKVNQEVSFYVDAYPDEKFKGRVAQVRLQPITTQNLVSYEVIIEVENRDNKLLPGMTANLSIIVDTKKDVIKVPNMALRFQPALTQEQFKKYSAMYGDKFDLKNSAMVWTLQSGELAPIIVDPGLTDGQYTEIRSDQLTIEQILVTGISTVAAPGSARDRFAPKK
ncbi:MAG TPA: efflux RND transporter periplasmic adaptor subunit [bacterium]|nr:efflux RND transporter periplasmic adaptor subunit [bacterium]HNB09618.1 efflux RND transporter periplasmic adaptor subunit [bacterium]HND76038.1 efflux RND transporter periplasmic adaptor subunit [bacterium]HNF85092.1 efflux RND transporter periplasmic adaptor subunit [bacterium]HNH28739.1 efflux RND transporter periplasmic adaptor subunit [bacterium]